MAFFLFLRLLSCSHKLPARPNSDHLQQIRRRRPAIPFDGAGPCNRSESPERFGSPPGDGDVTGVPILSLPLSVDRPLPPPPPPPSDLGVGSRTRSPTAAFLPLRVPPQRLPQIRGGGFVTGDGGDREPETVDVVAGLTRNPTRSQSSRLREKLLPLRVGRARCGVRVDDRCDRSHCAGEQCEKQPPVLGSSSS